MKRLSLEDLKAQASQKVTNNLEAIKGGNAGDCHCQTCSDIADMIKFFADVYNAIH
jgi:hypothetical protein